MWIDTVTIDETIGFLNKLISVDSEAVHDLVETRVPCNEEFANHPTVQVVSGQSGQEAQVGLLGILNGLFGIDNKGYGPISAIFDKDMLVGFRKTV